MTHLAHWAHRLYPKYDFDDCILAIENQGKKKVLGSYMKNFRHDLLQDDVILNSDDDDDEGPAGPAAAPEIELDEMDRMLSEEISRRDRTFDDLGVRALDSTIDSLPSQPSMVAPPAASSTLTEEQLQRIEENRRRALARLKQRQQIDESDLIPTPPALSEEQKRQIEENKRRALEKLKQRQQLQGPPVEIVDTPIEKVIEINVDEDMQPLIYESD